MITRQKTPYLIFAIDDRKLAIELEVVEQVFSAVEITPLEGAPETILGLINVHGAIIVVLNVRKKLDLHQRSIELSDQIIMVNVDDRQLGLLVDDVVEVLQTDPQQFEAMMVPDETPSKPSQAKQGFESDNTPIELYDLRNFLSEEEEKQLRQALQTAYKNL
jgi:purine-binding chemotaxis protein CheW